MINAAKVSQIVILLQKCHKTNEQFFMRIRLEKNFTIWHYALIARKKHQLNFSENYINYIINYNIQKFSYIWHNWLRDHLMYLSFDFTEAKKTQTLICTFEFKKNERQVNRQNSTRIQKIIVANFLLKICLIWPTDSWKRVNELKETEK